jgi:hypothetical protein
VIETSDGANGAEDIAKQTSPPAKPENKVAEIEEGGNPSDLMQFMSQVVPIDLRDVAPPDRSLQVTYQQAQSVAVMTVMMLLFALSCCGSVLLVEREEGTLNLFRGTPCCWESSYLCLSWELPK